MRRLDTEIGETSAGEILVGLTDDLLPRVAIVCRTGDDDLALGLAPGEAASLGSELLRLAIVADAPNN
jgi:hypothetical protein